MEFSVWVYVLVVLTLFSELTAQTYSNEYNDLTAFPTDIPANTTQIKLGGNKINSFPDNAFDKFYQLERLNLGGNPFTQLPNITQVGDTLKFLLLYNCKLTELNAVIFNELIVLEWIHVNYCPLTSFPDVAGPGNTLQKLEFPGFYLKTFPVLSHYRSLTYIKFARNRMTNVPEAAVASLHLSGELYLQDTKIPSLPDYPKQYENITHLDLSNTLVSFFLKPLYIVINYENNNLSYNITNVPWDYSNIVR